MGSEERSVWVADIRVYGMYRVQFNMDRLVIQMLLAIL